MREEIKNILSKITDFLKQDYNAQKVVLFGSYARGEENSDSDIDLFILAQTEKGFYRRIADVKKSIRHLRNGLPISPIVLTPKELDSRKSISDAFILEILEEGISL